MTNADVLDPDVLPADALHADARNADARNADARDADVRNADPIHAPPRPARPPLAYDADATRATGAVLRCLRWLIVLMLANTTLLGMSVLGPDLFPFLRQQWAQWKADRAAKKAQEQALQTALALRQQALSHTIPAGTVVYDEDPAESARLIRDGGTAVARVRAGQGNTPRGWLPPVMAVTPRLYSDYLSSVTGAVPRGWSNPLLFLHERTAPGGVKHVVAVQLHPEMRFNESVTYNHATRIFRVEHRQAKQRSLVVRAWPVGTAAAPEPPKPPPANSVTRTYRLRLPDTPERVIARRESATRDGNDSGPIDYGNVLRFYAAQPDADDPSHFTLPYRLDGRDGVIDGWVKDDGVMLRPRDGDWAFDADEVLRLNAPPATAPAIYPPAAGG